MATVTLKGYDQLRRQMDAITRVTWLRQGIQRAVNQIAKPIAQTYPPESHRPQPFVSDRQRRGFFAKLRSGEIQVPYQRTYTLKNNWQVKQLAGTATALENETPYGGWVQGDQRQTRYHRGTGWNTETKIANKAEPKIIKYLDGELTRLWK